MDSTVHLAFSSVVVNITIILKRDRLRPFAIHDRTNEVAAYNNTFKKELSNTCVFLF